MAHLTLNCPQCRKQLVYVPLDGLTLHYRCHEHGSLILRPLMVISSADECHDATATHLRHQLHTPDAA
jgi:hypothetical protein